MMSYCISPTSDGTDIVSSLHDREYMFLAFSSRRIVPVYIKYEPRKYSYFVVDKFVSKRVL